MRFCIWAMMTATIITILLIAIRQNLLTLIITNPLVRRPISALLVMEFQTIIFNNFLPQKSAGIVIRNTTSLMAAVRTADIPVIYVSVGFCKGYPEVSQNNTIFSSIKNNGIFMAGSHGATIQHHNDLRGTRDRRTGLIERNAR